MFWSTVGCSPYLIGKPSDLPSYDNRSKMAGMGGDSRNVDEFVTSGVSTTFVSAMASRLAVVDVGARP